MSQLKWAPEDSFNFNGTDFSILHNGLQAVMNSPVYQEHLAIAKNVASIGQLFELTSKKLQEGIDAGFVKTIEDTPVDTAMLEQEHLDSHIMD